MIALALGTMAFSADAQIIVKVRPPRPHYVRVAPPTPRHVWIEEDWRPRGQEYEFAGGRWAEPPRPGQRWVPGHWANRGNGSVWIEGHWKGGRRR